jgi:putative N6-adenine-specific DNA methylase
MPVTPTLACFAVTPPGVEAITAAELGSLGLTPGATEPGGVSFSATAAGLYGANLSLCTANRVLVRLAEFSARAFYELERKAKRVPWETVVASGAAVRFRVTSRKSRLYHVAGIAERLYNCVNGQQSTVNGTSPAGEDEDEGPAADPTAQLFVVRVLRDVVTISADSSGALLHRRGYRLAAAKAPLRETLAAAMLLGAGYDGAAPLVDPFSGSGTIPIEAALLARRIAPGLRRGFAFERWPSFDEEAWREVKAAAEARVLARAPAPIAGSDRDAGAIEAARANAVRADVAENIDFRRAALSSLEPPPGPGFLVTNPPFGVRIGERDALRDLYARLGQVVRSRCRGWTVAILAARAEHARATGLPLEPVWSSSSGGVKIRLFRGSPSTSA